MSNADRLPAWLSPQNAVSARQAAVLHQWECLRMPSLQSMKIKQSLPHPRQRQIKSAASSALLIDLDKNSFTTVSKRLHPNSELHYRPPSSPQPRPNPSLRAAAQADLTPVWRLRQAGRSIALPNRHTATPS